MCSVAHSDPHREHIIVRLQAVLPPLPSEKAYSPGQIQHAGDGKAEKHREGSDMAVSTSSRGEPLLDDRGEGGQRTGQYVHRADAHASLPHESTPVQARGRLHPAIGPPVRRAMRYASVVAGPRWRA